MRVIGGKYRRRKLESLPGLETRPMLDRVRETLFNILQDQVAGKVFADLYAGTGAVGIEALSRGASRSYFVENNGKATRVIDANLTSVGAQSSASVLLRPVAEALESIEADIYFLGPPYPLKGEYTKTLTALSEKPCELVIAQHSVKLDLAEEFEQLKLTDRRKLGANVLSFYRPSADEPDPPIRNEQP